MGQPVSNDPPQLGLFIELAGEAVKKYDDPPHVLKFARRVYAYWKVQFP